MTIEKKKTDKETRSCAKNLVKHEVRAAAQIGLARVEKVEEAARRGDNNLHAVFEVARLRALGRPAKQARVLDAGRGAILGGNLLDLLGKLTSGSKHKDLRVRVWDSTQTMGPSPRAR
jgi:hypothetical protein